MKLSRNPIEIEYPERREPGTSSSPAIPLASTLPVCFPSPSHRRFTLLLPRLHGSGGPRASGWLFSPRCKSCFEHGLTEKLFRSFLFKHYLKLVQRGSIAVLFRGSSWNRGNVLKRFFLRSYLRTLVPSFSQTVWTRNLESMGTVSGKFRFLGTGKLFWGLARCSQPFPRRVYGNKPNWTNFPQDHRCFDSLEIVDWPVLFDRRVGRNGVLCTLGSIKVEGEWGGSLYPRTRAIKTLTLECGVLSVESCK